MTDFKGKKLFIGLLFTGLVVLGLVLIGPAGNSLAADKPMVLKLGHVLSPTHNWNVAAVGFAKDVEKETQGRIKINVFPSGQLGNEEEMIRSCSTPWTWA